MNIKISDNSMINAIYFGLITTDYNFYKDLKSQEIIDKAEQIRKIKLNTGVDNFFRKTYQNSCEAYPYWPRAALLETATFFIHRGEVLFTRFHDYYEYIKNLNIFSEIKEDKEFWYWINMFPESILKIVENEYFLDFDNWSHNWIEGQNEIFNSSLKELSHIVSVLTKKYSIKINNIDIILAPLKCAYSADYYKDYDTLYVILGKFDLKYVMHEFLHIVVHKIVLDNCEHVLTLNKNTRYKNLDKSYYADSDECVLNAFEENIVRELIDVYSELENIDIVNFIMNHI
ncbi:MAG: hypothetical protein FWC47_11740 [Oscillospiraceae bacterium]|nr:hypothetical protein [Oscillospiraceae bacterium]